MRAFRYGDMPDRLYAHLTSTADPLGILACLVGSMYPFIDVVHTQQVEGLVLAQRCARTLSLGHTDTQHDLVL